MPSDLQGRLPRPPIHELFRNMALSSRSGALHLEHDGVVKRIHFARGRICFASTNRPDERLGALAVRERLATWWQVQEAARGLDPRRRLGGIMVDLGILSPEERNRLVRGQLREIVVEALGWTVGCFRLEEGAVPQGEAITLDWPVADAFLEACRRAADEKRLWAGVGGLAGLPEPLRDQGLRLPTGLDSAERRVVASLDGRRTVAEIIQAAAVPPGVAVRTLSALALSGGLRVAGDPEIEVSLPSASASSPRPAPRAEAGPRPIGRPPADPVPPEVRRERSELLDLVAELPRMNHYQVLGLQPGASPEAIARAFGERAARFHADRANDPALADLRGILERARQAVEIAHRTLSDPGARAGYDAQRQEEWQRQGRSAAAAQAGSQAYLERAGRLLREGRLPDAIPPLQEAVRLRPDLAVAHFRLGQCLATMQGQMGAARDHLRRAAELEPEERRYRDALLSVRPQQPRPRPRLARALQRLLHLAPPHEEG